MVGPVVGTVVGFAVGALEGENVSPLIVGA